MKTFLASFAFVAATAIPASAVDVSFEGELQNADSTQLFIFTLDSAATVNIESYGYAGGTQQNGTIVGAGGFDGVLTVFDLGFSILAQDSDGSMRDDSDTGLSLDASLSVLLGAGTYLAGLSVFPALPLEGLFFEEHGDFAGRTSDWNVDFFNVSNVEIIDEFPNTAFIPLPAGLPLLVAGLGGIALLRRRRS